MNQIVLFVQYVNVQLAWGGKHQQTSGSQVILDVLYYTPLSIKVLPLILNYKTENNDRCLMNFI